MTSRMAKIKLNTPFFRVLSRFFGIIRDCSPPPLFATLHVGSQQFLILFSNYLTYYYGFITLIDFPFLSCYINKWR